jgi:hypothetical protein
VKNILIVACLVAIPFAAARAAVRFFSDNSACHSCTGAFNEVGPSGGPEMECTTNNCKDGCYVLYQFWEDEFGAQELWSCICSESVMDMHCELEVERLVPPHGNEFWIQSCWGACIQRGGCAGTTCKKNGTYWLTCDCDDSR